MPHPTFAALVDYLNQQLTKDRHDDIEQHLATCTECQRDVTHAKAFLTNTHAAAPAPPRSLVHRAMAAFNRQVARTQQRLIEAATPSFDSWAQGAVSGARGASADRQLLYSVDAVDLDLQISPSGQHHGLALRGQILTEASQPGELEGITIRVLSAGEERALRLTDELGRFSISDLAPGAYSMQVELDEQDILIEEIVLTG